MRFVFDAVRGVYHARLGLPGADYAAAFAGGDAFCFAVCDGAGSSVRGHLAADYLARHVLMRMLLGDMPVDAVKTAASGMLAVVSSPSEYYTTVVAGCVKAGYLQFASVGDSPLLWRAKGVWRASPVVKGEHAGETAFVGMPEWESYLMTGEANDVDAILATTDGLSGVYFGYTYSEGRGWMVVPDATYLDRLVAALISGELGPEEFSALLSSGRVMAINDDDKGAVLWAR